MSSPTREELIAIHELTGMEIKCSTCSHKRVTNRGVWCNVGKTTIPFFARMGYPITDFICTLWKMKDGDQNDPTY